ncbi:MAG: IPT/TIG domain-containing protein [Acidimicrobiales bacterium]
MTNGDGTNTAGPKHQFVAPTVKKLSPAWADPATATIITITGEGFTGVTAADVKFGTTAATALYVVSDTTIVAETPVDDTVSNPNVLIDRGVTDVTVANNSVASATSANSKFLFTPGKPTVTHLGATGAEVTGTDDAAVGATLTITGTQLWGVKEVAFGTAKVTKEADISVATDGNTLTVKVPSRAAGSAEVTVTNAAGTSVTNLKTLFNYYSTAAPKISAWSPSVFDKTDGTGGGTMLVTGTGFTGVDESDITLVCGSDDVTPTSAAAVGDTSLIVVVPHNGGAAETCDLKIANAVDATKTATAAAAFRYV